MKKCVDCRGRGTIDGFDCKCCDGLSYHINDHTCYSEEECSECYHPDDYHEGGVCTYGAKIKPGKGLVFPCDCGYRAGR